MPVINTNVNSLVAQGSLNINNRSLSKAMNQLSTGSRINSAADDAAGLAISDNMTSQIRGLNQAVRNANDGIALLQVAESSLVEVTSMMQRMRELAVQSANDTNTDEDRDYLDLEFQQLKSEIGRVVSNTEWNGKKLLDGSHASNTGTFTFQVGANAGSTQRITHTIDDMDLQASYGTLTEGHSISGGNQTTLVTFANTGGSWAEGDVITISAGDNSIQYTVTAANVAGTDGEDASAIAAAVDAAIGTSWTGYSVTSSGAGLSIAKTAGTFAYSDSANKLELASVNGLDVQNQSNSSTAISGLDTALESVASARAEIGSVINRLTSAADNLANVSTNTSASRSRILDTDYAQATTELARAQIIQQAATAMLAQANQQPQTVLSLLK